MAARNITLVLHPSVASASVLPPGVQGKTGFPHLARRRTGASGHVAPTDHVASTGGHVAKKPSGPRRAQWSTVVRGRSGVEVTVDSVGGGGAFVKIEVRFTPIMMVLPHPIIAIRSIRSICQPTSGTCVTHHSMYLQHLP